MPDGHYERVKKGLAEGEVRRAAGNDEELPMCVLCLGRYATFGKLCSFCAIPDDRALASVLYAVLDSFRSGEYMSIPVSWLACDVGEDRAGPELQRLVDEGWVATLKQTAVSGRKLKFNVKKIEALAAGEPRE